VRDRNVRIMVMENSSLSMLLEAATEEAREAA
jgi:hypothetical protein